MITHTHEKTYKVREGWDNGQQHYYDITYTRAFGDKKYIRFYLIEHYLQFIDLLHEAHYYAPADCDPYS
jgi:hypothetical protein